MHSRAFFKDVFISFVPVAILHFESVRYYFMLNEEKVHPRRPLRSRAASYTDSGKNKSFKKENSFVSRS